MSFVLTKKLPTPMEIKELYPVSAELAALKAAKDQELIDIITGASDKFMVIIGPCSADNEEAVCDYIGRLTKVQEKVKDKLVLVPRVYTNKPRTTGEGYNRCICSDRSFSSSRRSSSSKWLESVRTADR